MTVALEGGEWSAARSSCTLPPGKTRYPFYRRLGGSQGRSGRAENPVPIGIRSRTVQSVVSRYTDWATRPTYKDTTLLYSTHVTTCMWHKCANSVWQINFWDADSSYSQLPSTGLLTTPPHQPVSTSIPSFCLCLGNSLKSPSFRYPRNMCITLFVTPWHYSLR